MLLSHREIVPGGGIRFVERIDRSVSETHRKLYQQTHCEVSKINDEHTITRLQRTMNSVLAQGEHEKYNRQLLQTITTETTDRLELHLTEKSEYLQFYLLKTDKVQKIRNDVEELLREEISDFNNKKKLLSDHIDGCLHELKFAKKNLREATENLAENNIKNRDLNSLLEESKTATEEAIINKQQVSEDMSTVVDGRASGCFELEQSIKELSIRMEEVSKDLDLMRPIEEHSRIRDPIHDTIEEVLPELKWIIRRSTVLRAALISSSASCLTVDDLPETPFDIQVFPTRVFLECLEESSERLQELELLIMKFSYTPEEWASGSRHLVDVGYQNSSLSNETRKITAQIKAVSSDLSEYRKRATALEDLTEFDKIHLQTRRTYSEEAMYERAVSKVQTMRAANAKSQSSVSNLQIEAKDLRKNLGEALIQKSKLREELLRLRKFVTTHSV